MQGCGVDLDCFRELSKVAFASPRLRRRGPVGGGAIIVRDGEVQAGQPPDSGAIFRQIQA